MGKTTRAHIAGTCLSQMALTRHRGWTLAGIKKFLGEPDLLEPGRMYKSQPPRKLWLISRIEAAEATPEYHAWAAQVATRKAAAARAVDTKRARLFAYIEGLEIKVPLFRREVLIVSACTAYNNFKYELIDRGRIDGSEFEPATPESDSAFLDRIIVNHLRHRCSRYEREIDRLYGKVGKEEGYPLLYVKVMRAIAAAYPELSEECKRQIERKGEQG